MSQKTQLGQFTGAIVKSRICIKWIICSTVHGEKSCYEASSDVIIGVSKDPGPCQFTDAIVKNRIYIKRIICSTVHGEKSCYEASFDAIISVSKDPTLSIYWCNCEK